MRRLSWILCGMVGLGMAALKPPALAQVVRIEANDAGVTAMGVAAFHGGSAKSPAGRVIGVNAEYMTLDGKPWLPVMGEFHYSRYPEGEWEDEIRKMQAAGVQVISTYVIWIHHEEVQGKFDWSGQKNLRKFAELCQKHGMLLYPRVGPWAHAEVRNGGLPDWVLPTKVRTNDPAYMAEVKAFYGQVGEQLKGMLWKDGGPVIGVQIENEYAKRGEGAGAEHLAELKKMVVASGIDVPMYTVTAWDGAAMLPGELLPVQGGYPDAPWDGGLEKLKPSEVYAFRYGSRVSGAMQKVPVEVTKYGVPFLTAEMGGGMQVTYRRRPVVNADDVTAMMPVMLGSGANLYGEYMAHGGVNPEGLTTLNESEATGYPNDLPVKSYDFESGLGAYGQERASWRTLKLVHYFLNEFGERLAPMRVFAPEDMPKGPEDFGPTRVSVRTDGVAGFVFGNNYVRGYEMPARKGFQVILTLASGSVKVPETPVDVAAGGHFIWPVNLKMGSSRLRYSTAQPLTKIETETGPVYVFFEVTGVKAEFAFDRKTEVVAAKEASIERTAWAQVVRGVAPGLGAAMTVTGTDGKKVTVLLLTKEQAEDCWRVRDGAVERLLITKGQVLVSEKGLTLRSVGVNVFAVAALPELERAYSSNGDLRAVERDGLFTKYEAYVGPKKWTVKWEQVAQAKPLGAERMVEAIGRHGALVPDEAAWEGASRWSVTAAPALAKDVKKGEGMKGMSNLYLKMSYVGDMARMYGGKKLLDDDFYSGQEWLVSWKRLAGILNEPLELQVLPMRKGASIFLDAGKMPVIAGAQMDGVKSIEVVPEYQVDVVTR